MLSPPRLYRYLLGINYKKLYAQDFLEDNVTSGSDNKQDAIRTIPPDFRLGGLEVVSHRTGMKLTESIDSYRIV
jgi:hypothetical protein